MSEGHLNSTASGSLLEKAGKRLETEGYPLEFRAATSSGSTAFTPVKVCTSKKAKTGQSEK